MYVTFCKKGDALECWKGLHYFDLDESRDFNFDQLFIKLADKQNSKISRTAINSHLNLNFGQNRLLNGVACPEMWKKFIFNLVKSLVTLISIRSSPKWNRSTGRTLKFNPQMSLNFG